MSNKLSKRVKSAAFIRRQACFDENPEKNYQKGQLLSALPISQSRLTTKPTDMRQKSHHVFSCSHFNAEQRIPTSTSDVWRKVNSSRSEFSLKKLQKGINNQPIRLNLMEKVLRIKQKQIEKDEAYQIQLINLRNRSIKNTMNLRKQILKPQFLSKINDVIVPYERKKLSEEKRYRERLLKIKKN